MGAGNDAELLGPPEGHLGAFGQQCRVTLGPCWAILACMEGFMDRLGGCETHPGVFEVILDVVESVLDHLRRRGGGLGAFSGALRVWEPRWVILWPLGAMLAVLEGILDCFAAFCRREASPRSHFLEGDARMEEGGGALLPTEDCRQPRGLRREASGRGELAEAREGRAKAHVHCFHAKGQNRVRGLEARHHHPPR